MIKAIIFDWGGVISIRGSFEPLIKKWSEEKDIDPKEMHKTLRYWWEQARVDEIDSKLFWKNLSEFLKIDPYVFRKELIKYFGFRPETIELAKKLKTKYKIAILSNQIRDWLEEEIKKYKLDETFELIITSYESKKAKPDPEIFKKTAELLGVKIDECILIDDHTKNTTGAEKLGMKAILFNEVEQLKKELVELGVEIE